jgi:hypothetical protein
MTFGVRRVRDDAEEPPWVSELDVEARPIGPSYGGTYAAIAAAEASRRGSHRGLLAGLLRRALPLLVLLLAAVAVAYALRSAPGWRLELPARGAPAASRPLAVPEIVGASPVHGKAALRVGEAQDFAVAATGPRLRYAWTLDGRPAGTGPRWVYAAEPGHVGRRRVEVTVTAPGGVERRAWTVRVRPARAPRIVAVEPEGGALRGAVGAPLRLRLDAEPASAGEGLRTTWAVDGHPSGEGASLVLRPAWPGALEVRAVVSGDLGGSAAHTWRIAVAAPPPPPPEPRVPRFAAAPPEPRPAWRRPAPRPPAARAPPRPAPATGEEEVRRWLDRYAEAWRAHDVEALRRMGHVTTDGEVAALRRYFRGVRDLEVELNVLGVRTQGGRTLVRFTRRDRFRDPAGRLVMKESPTIEKQVVRSSAGLRFVRPRG